VHRERESLNNKGGNVPSAAGFPQERERAKKNSRPFPTIDEIKTIHNSTLGLKGWSIHSHLHCRAANFTISAHKSESNRLRREAALLVCNVMCQPCSLCLWLASNASFSALLQLRSQHGAKSCALSPGAVEGEFYGQSGSSFRCALFEPANGSVVERTPCVQRELDALGALRRRCRFILSNKFYFLSFFTYAFATITN
jgi:hypothetical protein